ncbi:cation:proton antiporter [PVC group bacterium]|nr:cation:proton antiporter [PVC group bacterium]
MDGYFLDICFITVSSALFAWCACRFRQPILLGYFLCGVLLGPWGFGLIQHTELLEHISHIGITLLLFLAGLVLHPECLAKYFRTAITVTISGCILSSVVVFGSLCAFGYPPVESFIASLALMFSSTILAIKLLPTTTLHQKRMGGICIAILIAQDIIAVVLIMIVGFTAEETLWKFVLLLIAKALLLIAVTAGVERYVLRKMMQSSEQFNEVLLILCLGWCLGIAALAEYVGLSYEIGAFIAGVLMARGKISLILSEQLKPLRDFFLMFFFFVLGAEFNLFLAKTVWAPALLLSVLIVTIRPVYMQRLLCIMGEEKGFAGEISFRLGQASEFALIVAVTASKSGRLSDTVSQLIQLTTILTMIASSYIVVFRFPTPIGTNRKLKRD